MSSCSSDDALVDFENSHEQQTATLSFTATLPGELKSRAAETSTVYGDGTKATTLYYAVYSVDTTKTVTERSLVRTNYGTKGDSCFTADTVKFVNHTATVDLNLAIGKVYEVAFWAQSPSADCYKFDTENGIVEVDYSKMVCNDDSVDAFYASTKVTFGQSTESHSVVLRRPFAQLNIGITDSAKGLEAGLSVEKSQIFIFGVCNKLNLLTGAATGFVGATYKYNTIPERQTGAGSFPAKENNVSVSAEYSAMAYVLVDSKKSLDIQYNYVDKTNTPLAGNDTHYLHNVPFEPNHRTNIYGDMFTTSQSWTIKIDQSFINPEYNNIYEQ
jgi:hypothetical protein